MPHCLAEIHAIYTKLGVLPFDHEHGESFYNPMLPTVVESLLQKQVAQPGDGGAIIIHIAKDNVALIRKRDGAFTYTTSDLATIQYRLEHFQPHALLYVVDFRQSQHFANLFETAKRWGVAGVEMTHISFGSVLGPDKRPIKTRKGAPSNSVTCWTKRFSKAARSSMPTAPSSRKPSEHRSRKPSASAPSSMPTCAKIAPRITFSAGTK